MAETDPDIRARARLLAATAFACACACAAPLEAQVRVTEILPRRSGASEPVVASSTGAGAGRFAQFADGAIWLDAAGSVALALAIAAALAFHPTRARARDAAEIDAERLAIVLSALVG
ncbi:MAG: hypothetical protein ACKO0W_08035, partial [Planctomycetota bacterium]